MSRVLGVVGALLAPPARDLIWGAVLTVAGSVVLNLGRQGSTGVALVGGVLALLGVMLLITGAFQLATNADLTAKAVADALEPDEPPRS